MSEARRREITVGMGEIKTSRKPAVFTCSGIGSCVLLFIYEAQSKIGGVAHIQLPNSQQQAGANKALYADTSPGLLIQQLVAHGADAARLKAKIVGGANMFEWASSAEMVQLGGSNIDTVKMELVRNRIYLAAEEIGGSGYKSARCDSLTGNIYIKTEKDKQITI